MADFSKIEIIDNPDGGATLIFDLDDSTLLELESLLGDIRTSQSFQKKFENFVENSITAYISRDDVSK